MRTPETAAVPATGSIPEGEPLSESPLISLAKIIRRGEPVVFVTGSGLSAPRGIPTFRGENGVWAKWVLDWGTRDAFLKDPRAWWNKFWLPAHVVAEPGSTIERQYEPSGGHSAMVEIAAARQTNVRVITQNIDGLHGRAGLNLDRLIEVHGRCGLFKCVTPGCRYAHAESIVGGPLDLAAAASEAEAQIPGLGHTEQLSASEPLPFDSGPSAGGRNAAAPPTEAGLAVEDGIAHRLAEVGGGAAATAIGALPQCPACSAPSLPQALLFDEEYESHSFYQYRKARRWLDGAKAIVFVGTSFAVGITEQALHVAEENRLPTFSFNIKFEEPMVHEASQQMLPLPRPQMFHIIGGCEVTLPKLAALVTAPVAKKNTDWFAGWIPPPVEAAVLAGRGSEWRERTAGGEQDRSSRGRRGKKRNREKEVPRTETVWVACDACRKWRRLPPGMAGPAADEAWRCEDNTGDPSRQSCKVPEEPW